jgi:hypothetical protein
MRIPDGRRVGLTRPEIKALRKLHAQLAEFGVHRLRTIQLVNTLLNDRLIDFSLNLIDRTPRNEEAIKATSYILAGFNRYDLIRPLNDAFSITCTLRMPNRLFYEDQLALFELLRRRLRAIKHDSMVRPTTPKVGEP